MLVWYFRMFFWISMIGKMDISCRFSRNSIPSPRYYFSLSVTNIYTWPSAPLITRVGINNLVISSKIGMEILSLKVVNTYGRFQQFMLYLLHNNVFAVAHHQDVARTQIDCSRPSFFRYIEGMLCRRSNGFSPYFDVYNLILFTYKRPNDFFLFYSISNL